ncbi:Lon protease family protein [Azoarcus taiwanensis]|uniref:endopeptidase La n=1 Tax=Azoarcus taiwanensis TaxID=666964 RepID=A0A972J8H3_9RHOO|nr:ATP-binding protein [Azoarcus taiwanensis]NMG03246.1 AAA family ATPase [Azoarcus taiwanensis]
MSEPKPLDPAMLFSPCDLSVFDFETTDTISPETEIFGQTRAVEALRFAVGVEDPGYNLFVLGSPGSNRHGIVRRLIEEHAQSRETAIDWCYVNNFADESRPAALRLPAGLGARLRRDMQTFTSELGAALTAGFESEDFRGCVERIQEEFRERDEGALQALGAEASSRGIAFMRTPRGFVFLPMKGKETMDQAEYAALPEAQRSRIDEAIEALREQLRKILHDQPRNRREMQARLREVGRETMTLAVSHLIEELKERYSAQAELRQFLDAVLEDVVTTGDALREQATSSNGEEAGIPAVRYQINLLVGHETASPAPVVFESNPTYPNLVGRVDHVTQMGMMVTNFTMIRPGALHRANGGYLLLDADKLLVQPFAWDGLKRALKSGEICMESLAQAYGWSSALPLEPEPIPLSLKVILFGQRRHYYLLKALDPEFDELFKVAADFEDELERTPDNQRLFARMVASLVREKRLLPFSRDAVGRLIEFSVREAGDIERLSLRTRSTVDLMSEAAHCARQRGADAVCRDDVKAAIDARIRRADRLRETMKDAVLTETIQIDTEGTVCGQVNGLAVVDLGDFRFARPVRISATARPGNGDVIDIERKAELGGAIHSKGVMILSSYLASHYAQDMPACLSASVVFEQSYGPVEGDSASLAELCALLSALAGIPVRQTLAVTGSVNQHGGVQAVGGVNEKIEGFFDLCRARGLNGDQGVIVPRSNVRHLMLREDLVSAVKNGQFQVYAVGHVDEAMTLLTGMPMRTEGKSRGLDQLITTRLNHYARVRQDFAEPRTETAATKPKKSIKTPAKTTNRGKRKQS